MTHNCNNEKGLKTIYYVLWRNVICSISKAALCNRKTIGLRVRTARIWSQLCLSLAVWPWTSFLIHQELKFLKSGKPENG